MTAEELIREALHEGMKSKSAARLEKYRKAEGALNAIGAARAAQAEVVAAARGVDFLDDGVRLEDAVEHIRAMLRKYDATIASLPGVS